MLLRIAITHHTLGFWGFRLEQVNINEVMEKMASKKDLHNFLTQECEAYLPKLDTVNIFFLSRLPEVLKR